MNREELEERIQEFLDGRLPEDERAAFEQRMGREPKLARRIEEYRAIRRALRDEPTELPPGFYARARERFEASHKPRRGWRWVLSWEATGLAAAALLLTALLLPSLLPDRPGVPPDGGEEPSAGPTATGDEGVGDKAGAVSEVGSRRDEPRQARPRESFPAEKEEVPRAVGRSMKSAEDARNLDSLGHVADEDLDIAVAAPASTAPAEQESGFLEMEARDRDLGVAPPPVEGSERLEPVATTEAHDDEWRRPEIEKKQLAQAEPDVRPVEGEMGFARSMPLVETDAEEPMGEGATALQAGSLGPEAFEIIGDRASWERIGAKRGRGSPIPARPDFSRQRVVLIGPREPPLDCAAISWRRVAGTILIEVRPPAPDATPAPGGCAVAIPAGPEPVRLVELPGTRDDR